MKSLTNLIEVKTSLAAKYERLAALTSSGKKGGKFKTPKRQKFEHKAREYRTQVQNLTARANAESPPENET